MVHTRLDKVLRRQAEQPRLKRTMLVRRRCTTRRTAKMCPSPHSVTAMTTIGVHIPLHTSAVKVAEWRMTADRTCSPREPGRLHARGGSSGIG